MQDAQIGLYDMVLSTTLESNKSLKVLVQWQGFQPNMYGFVPLSMAELSL